MFGNQKKGGQDNGPARKSSAPSGGSNALNSLVKGTVVEGTVKSENDIRIDGIIKGHLDCQSKVIIGPSGFVEGEIVCRNAMIEGRFEGKLTVREQLNIRETAEINGEIVTNKLIVQSGAIFNASCKMGNQANNNGQQPKLGKTVKAKSPLGKVTGGKFQKEAS